MVVGGAFRIGQVEEYCLGVESTRGILATVGHPPAVLGAAPKRMSR